MINRNRTLMISLIAVSLGFLLGMIVVLITGRNPINMIFAVIKSMTGFDLSKPGVPFNIVFVFNWFMECIPFILTGLSVAFAFRTGLFNIGGEGQYMVGSTAAAAVALFIEAPHFLHVTLCILAAGIAGALWGAIPGLLKAYRNIHEVVVCIMMNYMGFHFCNMLVRRTMPIDPYTNARTIAFPRTASLDQVLNTITSQFNWGFIIVIIAVIVFRFIIEKTTFGYSLKATGFNKDAAEFAGMKVKRNIVYSMAIAGSLAGIAGACVVLGIFRYGVIFLGFDNYGFNGIPVAFVGAATAPGVFLAGMLFALLKACNNSFQMFGIPKEISELIQSTIIYLIAIQYGIIYVVDKLKKKETDIVELEEERGTD